MNQKNTNHIGPGATASNALSAGFSRFAHRTANWTGHPVAFFLAITVIVIWIVTGPIFDYSDTWQLIINTGTTVVTFLMVFLIQNTQNRDMMTMQLKLSELVLGMRGAKNSFAAIEDLTDEELEALHQECRARAEVTGQHIEHRRRGTKPANGSRESPTAQSGAKARRRTSRPAAKP